MPTLITESDLISTFPLILENVPFISIVAEVNYLQKGMKEDVPVTTMTQPDGTGVFITLDTRVDYINISALGKLRINTGLFTPYILFGPKLDFEINNETKIGSPFSYKENFKKNIFGLKVGAGIVLTCCRLVY